MSSNNIFIVSKKCSMCNLQISKKNQTNKRRKLSDSSDCFKELQGSNLVCSQCNEPLKQAHWIDESLASCFITECSSQPESKSIEEMIPDISSTIYSKGRCSYVPFLETEADSVAMKNFENEILKEHGLKPNDATAKPTNKREAKIISKSVAVIDWNAEVDSIFASEMMNQNEEQSSSNMDEVQSDTAVIANVSLNQISNALPNAEMLADSTSESMATQIESLSKTLAQMLSQNQYLYLLSSMQA